MMVEIKIETGQLFTMEEAAEMTGIARATIYRWKEKGKVNVVEWADRTLVYIDEIERLKKCKG